MLQPQGTSTSLALRLKVSVLQRKKNRLVRVHSYHQLCRYALENSLLVRLYYCFGHHYYLILAQYPPQAEGYSVALPTLTENAFDGIAPSKLQISRTVLR